MEILDTTWEQDAKLCEEFVREGVEKLRQETWEATKDLMKEILEWEHVMESFSGMVKEIIELDEPIPVVRQIACDNV